MAERRRARDKGRWREHCLQWARDNGIRGETSDDERNGVMIEYVIRREYRKMEMKIVEHHEMHQRAGD